MKNFISIIVVSLVDGKYLRRIIIRNIFVKNVTNLGLGFQTFFINMQNLLLPTQKKKRLNENSEKKKETRRKILGDEEKNYARVKGMEKSYRW